MVKFRATHHLEGDFGPAQRHHGHNYRAVVVCKGPRLRDDGTLCDIALLDRAVSRAIEALQFQDMNSLPPFESRNSTAEAVAQYLHGQVASIFLQEGLSSIAVQVWESDRAYGAYEGPPLLT